MRPEWRCPPAAASLGPPSPSRDPLSWADPARGPVVETVSSRQEVVSTDRDPAIREPAVPTPRRAAEGAVSPHAGRSSHPGGRGVRRLASCMRRLPVAQRAWGRPRPGELPASRFRRRAAVAWPCRTSPGSPCCSTSAWAPGEEDASCRWSTCTRAGSSKPWTWSS
jgi:hypothetical protein